jgi:hypothetical protein
MNEMKRKISFSLVLTIMMVALTATPVFTGCGKEKAGSGKANGVTEGDGAEKTGRDAEVVGSDKTDGAGGTVSIEIADGNVDTAWTETTDENTEAAASEKTDEAAGAGIEPDITLSVGEGEGQTQTEPDADMSPDTEAPDNAADQKKAEKPVNIVWLGDSLTQGSLGDMDDNLKHAPYVRLKKLCADRGDVVEGFGYYAYVTSDIFWRYDEFYENGDPKDPEKVYVLWVGSNDFALSPDPLSAVPEVTAQIDKFVGGGIDKYIVLSHLPRAETRPEGLYKEINAALEKKYGERFLDITSCAPFPDGFQSDEVHLTQSSYNNVADAVYEKLIEMGYI